MQKQTRLQLKLLALLTLLMALVVVAMALVASALLTFSHIEEGRFLVKSSLAIGGLSLAVAIMISYFMSNFSYKERKVEESKKEVKKHQTPVEKMEEPVALKGLANLAGLPTKPGEFKETAVMVSHIRGFNEMVKNLESTELVGFLNDYTTRMSTCVYATGGNVEAITGDTVTAVWGLKGTLSNPSKGAMDATLLMRESLSSFNLKRASLGQEPVKMGCGVAFGSLVVVNGGMSGTTIIGDTLNLANRLADLTQTLNTDLLASNEAFVKVEPYYTAVVADKISIKGLTVPIYSIEGKKKTSLNLNAGQNRLSVFSNPNPKEMANGNKE